MCTGFMKKGKDLLYGFNLDIDPAVWNFDVYKTDKYFTVGITIGKRLYFTHGVNRDGHFGNLPYMNDCEHEKRKIVNGKARIDLITDRYIRGQYSFDDVMEILKTKTVVNVPSNSMHTLLGDKDGRAVIIEPEYGYREIKENFAVITNFPLLVAVENDSPWYGKDRYAEASRILAASDEEFDVTDGLNLLGAVKQVGQWGTRVSFVYSKNESCVYYFLNGNRAEVCKHYLK